MYYMDEKNGMGRMATARFVGVMGVADACGGVFVMCEMDSSCFEEIADASYVAASLGGSVHGSVVLAGAVEESECCGTGSDA